MNGLQRIAYRSYQKILWLVSHFLPFREPQLIKGPGSIFKLPELLAKQGMTRVLIVTDQGLMRLHLLDSLFSSLQKHQIVYEVFDEVVPNPTIDNIEQALLRFYSMNAQAIIAFGGGSPMDVAKAVGARVARPQKRIPDLKGILKVRKAIPPLFAVPTTAGTGSEATVAAVVTNAQTHEKYAINDPVLIPQYAILDPELTIQLPPFVTATTGLDALTHAIEAFIGKGNTPHTKAMALSSIRRIHQFLLRAYQNGSDREAREQMQLAAYEAGVAFTRAYVGNVHAIAHTFGGFYQIPHGLANAVLLPLVLTDYGHAIDAKMAEIAKELQLGNPSDSIEEQAKKVLELIRDWNQQMKIPHQFDVKVTESNLKTMVKRAAQEANPLYPVPVIYSHQDFERIIRQVAIILPLF